MATLLDGKNIAQQIKKELQQRVAKLREHTGQPPALATVLVGDNPASATYVRMKANACKRVGLLSRRVFLPQNATTDEVLAQIDQLNADQAVHGILLQHPVPPQVDERACFERIAPPKDVDGVSSANFGRLALGLPAHGAATPVGIIHLLAHYQIPIASTEAVVVGRSPILGKPMAQMLLNADATVTICHSKTRDLKKAVSRADLVVAAVGVPELIKGDWIKEGAVVVDAGYNPGHVGDTELAIVAQRASAYTPIPGGVGPMTIATLLAQTVDAAEGRTT